MEHQDDALLRTGSEEAILPQTAPRRGSNSRAFKVAGLTVLACLLLAGQALTAYFVFGQRGQINTLEKNADSMRKQLRSRPQAAPVQMQIPMSSMPLMMDFTDTGAKKTTPLTKLENTATVSLQKQVKDLLQNADLPQFNQTFLANLQSLKQDMDEDMWKGFETWIHHWLIFQMAQEKPPTPKPATGLQTKCNMEAAAQPTKLGSYKPQCDEQGNYLPVQCWHSTGFCWCVDKDGNMVPNTSVRHRKPDCDRARPMMGLPRTLQLKTFEDDK